MELLGIDLNSIIIIAIWSVLCIFGLFGHAAHIDQESRSLVNDYTNIYKTK